jgi:hypothetical protein
MAFTAAEIANITNSALDFYIEKGNVEAQNIQDKPAVKAFDANAGTFSGGKGEVSVAVKTGQGGLTLSGYQGDDQLTYGNPTGTKRANFPWKEMFQGMGLTHSELKVDGITVTENGSDQSTSMKDGREQHALANILDEKGEAFNEDYLVNWNALLWGDGSGDVKALAGVRSLILDNPALGSTGGINRTTNSWWRNRAMTAAAFSAGTGPTPLTAAATGGGVLLTYLQKERRQLMRYAGGSTVKHRCFAGSSFLDAMEMEIRSNGNYSQTGFRSKEQADGSMNTMGGVPFGTWNFEYDPTLDDLGYAKRAYVIDMAAIKLSYMQGEKKKKANPARPHDRFVMYTGVSTTAVMWTKRLRTSAVYDIA